MNDSRPIGVFDSGLGGLTVVRALTEVLPNENIIYFGDTGRVPYGTRSNETIEQYARQDERFLISKNVKMVIAACGTVSSVAPHTGLELDCPFVEVVSPAAIAAAKATNNQRIGVIGTSATVRSGAFIRKLNEANPQISVFQVACPLFVPLVENGWSKGDDEIAILTAKRYLQPLIEQNIDTLILGCTHFPILTDVISKIMGNHVTLINTGETAACEAANILNNKGLLHNNNSDGKCEFFVSDRVESFSATAGIFLGHIIDSNVTRVEPE